MLHKILHMPALAMSSTDIMYCLYTPSSLIGATVYRQQQKPLLITPLKTHL
jgi:hypothetical protein